MVNKTWNSFLSSSTEPSESIMGVSHVTWEAGNQGENRRIDMTQKWRTGLVIVVAVTYMSSSFLFSVFFSLSLSWAGDGMYACGLNVLQPLSFYKQLGLSTHVRLSYWLFLVYRYLFISLFFLVLLLFVLLFSFSFSSFISSFLAVSSCLVVCFSSLSVFQCNHFEPFFHRLPAF